MTLCTPEAALTMLAVTADWFTLTVDEANLAPALNAVARLIEHQMQRIDLMEAECSRLRQRLAYETGQR